MKNKLIAATALLAMLAVAQVHAAEDPDAPKVHKQSGALFMSGGYAKAQRDAMFKAQNKFPIQLIFEVEGQDLEMAGVKVTLTDLSGFHVVEAVSEGPYFYINPPSSGRYTIDAEYQGDKQSMTRDLVGRRYLVLEFKFHPQ
jgi:hypothetical protein